MIGSMLEKTAFEESAHTSGEGKGGPSQACSDVFTNHRVRVNLDRKMRNSLVTDGVNFDRIGDGSPG